MEAADVSRSDGTIAPAELSNLVHADQARPGGLAGLMLAIWDLAEVIYAPCFAPTRGTCLMFDGNGALAGCSADQGHAVTSDVRIDAQAQDRSPA